LRVVAALVVLAAVAACRDQASGGAAKGRRGPLEFPVEAAPVEARQVEYQIRGDGTIDVFERVQVTARVAGVVEKVSFREGDAVKANQVLATIDPARFDLAARQAKAAVDRAQASVAEAEAGLDRRKQADAQRPGIIPSEEIAQWQTRVDQARADLSERKVALQRARLDQRDAYVRAPTAGEVQSRDAITGMYAQPGTLLATLVRRDPLLVRFDVDETAAPRIRRGHPIRFTVSGDDRTWTAEIRHIAEVADPRSRLVRVTAEVTSPERAELRAGGFAQVVVPVDDVVDAPVVPELAIRPSERGFLVFVLDDGAARETVVELGLRTADGMVEVRRGLTVGQVIVVRGTEALRDGAKVRVVDGTGAAEAPR
jgi:membrane fusion protein, multidrug efflux system